MLRFVPHQQPTVSAEASSWLIAAFKKSIIQSNDTLKRKPWARQAAPLHLIMLFGSFRWGVDGRG